VRAWRKDWGLDGPLVVIGDTHFPFHDRVWLEWVYQRIDEIQPAYVVQIGDLHDNYSLSKYARSYSVMTPAEEVERADTAAMEMWASIGLLAPRAKKFQIKGNHDDRAEHRLLEKCPELAPLVDLNGRYTFPGVTLVEESNEELLIGDVFLHHGHKKFGEHARYNQAPTIVGHLHKGDVKYYANRLGAFWELNVGYGGDVSSPVFRYRYQKLIHGWTLGLGLVDEHGPHFLCFPGAK
jgi:predicted phosphodiesterase